ncbi:MAG: 3-hydroxyacyl-ACP dehydratase FabZ [Lachnospiraceae bacterium]|nr:3-hydroxyacyl-ACP dehydratase FabZ [Lachnospiraceae bacterium]
MVLNSNQIQEIIPHRYPFLLVDKIVELEPGKRAKGIKCVTANEMQFLGHFPQKHVMPGVLILEALAQTGAIALLTEEENKGKVALFGGIKKAKFRAQVVPGDVLELNCEMVSRKGALGVGKTEAYVDGKLACEAEMMFAIDEES